MTIRKHKGSLFDLRSLRQLIDEHDNGNVSRAARRIVISQPSLFEILSGKHAPRAATFARMAKVYGVSTDWLFSGETRTAADTFDSGLRYTIGLLRKEPDRLEESLAQRASPLRPPHERCRSPCIVCVPTEIIPFTKDFAVTPKKTSFNENTWSIDKSRKTSWRLTKLDTNETVDPLYPEIQQHARRRKLPPITAGSPNKEVAAIELAVACLKPKP